MKILITSTDLLLNNIETDQGKICDISKEFPEVYQQFVGLFEEYT